jgi:hypothetical protein
MPKLQLLGRNWRVASDDFVGLGIASLLGRLAWYVLNSVFNRRL